MKYLIYRLDSRLNLMVILFLFWALFWGLNGGDKFFNGEQVPNVEDWSAKGVLLNERGDISYTLHPIETVGLFGVNRDAKMINYFQGIYLPKALALFALYSIALFELVLGVTFLALFGWSLLPTKRQQQLTLFADRTIHRLAFKGSICVFLLFSVGDTLFGDRIELWEHGTFIILCLVTYDMWYRTDQFFLEQDQPEITDSTQEALVGSSQALAYRHH